MAEQFDPSNLSLEQLAERVIMAAWMRRATELERAAIEGPGCEWPWYSGDHRVPVAATAAWRPADGDPICGNEWLLRCAAHLVALGGGGLPAERWLADRLRAADATGQELSAAPPRLRTSTGGRRQ